MKDNVVSMYKSREMMIEATPLEYSDLAVADTAAFDQYEALDKTVDVLGQAIEDYFQALYDYADENTEELTSGVEMMGIALDDAWADAQLQLSKLAVMLGIEGNEAFQRKVG